MLKRNFFPFGREALLTWFRRLGHSSHSRWKLLRNREGLGFRQWKALLSHFHPRDDLLHLGNISSKRSEIEEVFPSFRIQKWPNVNSIDSYLSLVMNVGRNIFDTDIWSHSNLSLPPKCKRNRLLISPYGSPMSNTSQCAKINRSSCHIKPLQSH